jgi:hypothetical protein
MLLLQRFRRNSVFRPSKVLLLRLGIEDSKTGSCDNEVDEARLKSRLALIATDHVSPDAKDGTMNTVYTD